MQNYEYKLLEDDTYCVMSYFGDEEHVIVPDTFLGRPVTVLFDCLFRGHEEITSIDIPDTVTDIGEFAFDRCTGLRRISLPSQLRNIWQYAFVRSGLEEIALPQQVANIMPFTFKDCRHLRKVVCSPELKKIYGWAFQGCTSLQEVVHSAQTDVSPKAYDTAQLNSL